MSSSPLKLFMLLLGSKAPGRHVEQHDFFFGIAGSLKELIPAIKEFWKEAGDKIHIDGWREVNIVEGYRISIVPRTESTPTSSERLFFINLGGYQRNKFEEQHYVVLTVQPDRASASHQAKKTVFYETNHFPGAESHIDDKYGIDVDDLYEIEDILVPGQKEKYQLRITPEPGAPADELHLGYFKLSSL